MKFSQRVGGFFEDVRRALKANNGTPFVFPAWGGSQGIGSLIDYATYADKGYGQNAVVHACVREISRSAPSAKLQVQRKLVNSQMEVWEEHRLQAVLDRPNRYQSQAEFLELYYTYLNIDGNAFLIRERVNGRTVALWLARPDRMRPIVSEGALQGFVYVAENGERTPWLAEDVIHIKEPNPGDPFEGLGRGLAPLAAAAVETDVDNHATAFSKAFFENAAVPFGLLKSKNILSDAEVSRIRSRIKEQYSGARKWHEMMILDADAEYQRMGLDLTEMAFPDLRAISETRICAVFKVPPILVGIKAGLDASTYSNYTQARRAMWEDKIIPDNAKLADALSAAFASELGKYGRIGHDYSQVVALQEDRNSRFARANQGVNGGWITVNEARREVGLGPVNGGDIFLRPLMSTERGSASEQGSASERGSAGGGDNTPDPQPNQATDEDEEKGRSEKGLLSEDRRALVWKRRDQAARAWELRFVAAARQAFGEEAREIEAAVRANKKRLAEEEKALAWDGIWQALLGVLGEQQARWVVLFKPLLAGLLGESGEEWGEELGIDWNFRNPKVAEFLEVYSLTFAQRIGETTKELLRGLLERGMEEGWQVTQLLREVGSLYDGWKDFQRAEMIARSETIRALNAGANEAYRQAGVTQKEWYASEDERTCEFCGEMHGKTVGVEETWWKQGDVMQVGESALRLDYEDVGYPPLHPDCRCTVLPVIGE